MMSVQSYHKLARVACVALALSGLAGCALQDEAAARAAVGDWVQLGETQYYFSRRNCAAGVFEVKATRISSLLTKARSIRAGLRHLDNNKPVAFEVEGLSPNMVSVQVMTMDQGRGNGIFAAGIVGKDCMLEEVSRAYLIALLDPTSVLIYEPRARFMAVVDRTNRRLFYAQGGGS
ncbi:hypothetical protein PhaeoP75_01288 [Phaeobacter gallaeciensis]|uniref:Lipoprotein n=2 Tax=Phaeobacter gallaeciensis TaxID=60890 RepID=A0AAC9Z9F8_9RHOB|nr:hypothetical protein Gal_01246 [Phaeobacter gallaeciensis DSM 26640]ATE92282.1 hypothetical protein PhaeoP11_01241 [Phaeobacter gallaeciensis]ATE97899.1 hypothetical protein PhaeoP73_02608 [Phaeobacter gallaeciensis]ATF00944.1 hypothetical protein PhaeoP75_01288 [Phaeobacter gallaeciensis]ATF05324.1 hypothetical protein PhaeoP63_01236 [Phaeobacter gallaeciensis]